jgi:hypothetical protein
VPETAPDAEAKPKVTDVLTIAWLNVADSAAVVVTPVAPAVGEVAVIVGAATSAVVNDHVFAGESA